MATHRIVLVIDDEEIQALGETLDEMDTKIDSLRDDWAEDEEPLASLYTRYQMLGDLHERIGAEVLAS